MRTAKKNNNVPVNPRSPRPVSARTDPAKEWLKSIRGTLSPHTERALRTDIGLYRSWCRTHRRTPWPVRAVDLARFVDSMARDKATATVERHVFSITALCRGVGWKDPRRLRVLANALKRMRRVKDCRQTQAFGLTRSLVDQLMAAQGDRLIDVRNRALLAVAYDAMLRRSELVALQVIDLALENDHSATLLVRRSKTDPEGGGALLFLAPDTLALVAEWLEQSGIDDGFLFRSIRRNGTAGKKLDPSQVPRIYKSMARKAGLDGDIVARISGHSTRVGAAQDMVASCIPMPAIMQAGRWKSTAMVSRYSERILPRRSGSALLASLQKRLSNQTQDSPDRFPASSPGGTNRRNRRRKKTASRQNTIASNNPGKSAFFTPKRTDSRRPLVPRFLGFLGNMTSPPPKTAESGAENGHSRAQSAIDIGIGEIYSQTPDSGNYQEQQSGLKPRNQLFSLGFLFRPLLHRLSLRKSVEKNQTGVFASGKGRIQSLIRI